MTALWTWSPMRVLSVNAQVFARPVLRQMLAGVVPSSACWIVFSGAAGSSRNE
jgi:hypothetical protein